MADDNQSDDEFHNPMAFFMNGAMSKEQQEEHRRFHERQEMARNEYTNRLHALIDDLNAEQLLTLRSILNVDSREWQKFLDGQIYTLLRIKFEVDPLSGEKPLGPESLLETDVEREASNDDGETTA